MINMRLKLKGRNTNVVLILGWGVKRTQTEDPDNLSFEE